jgi:L-arabinose transport system substrate-binding protein
MIYIFVGLIMAAMTVVGCDKSQKPTVPAATAKIKIGFLVKQPEETWFQNEWKFAQQAADQDKFDLIKIGIPDGEKALAAIDNLSAQGAQGFVICTPDVRLGPAIAAKADAANMKLLSVDDRFLGADGQPMDAVHHLGISAHNIGILVGKSLAEEMNKRGWKADDTAVCAVTFEELDTARQRTDGAIEALTAANFPKDNIYKAPQKTSDVPGAFDAANVLLTQHSDVKHWLICGMNDSAVMGAVRAMEGRGFDTKSACGIGINGTDCLVEFQKEKPTAFWGSILLTAKRHGYETTQMLYEWIKDGKEPPKATYTDGILITRETYKGIMKEQGLSD